MSRSWLVGKQLSLSSFSLVHTYALGGVELRSHDSLTTAERDALAASAAAEGLLLEHFKYSPVACTIVVADDHMTANESAEAPIEELLDFQEAYEVGGRFSRNSIVPASFIRDLTTGAVSAGKTQLRTSVLGKPMRVKNWFWEPPDAMRRAYATSGFELEIQLRRSIHWWRRARSEHDAQIRLLWRWFAIEALCKTRVEETDVTPRVRWFLGFPVGAALTTVPPARISAWQSLPQYAVWQEKVVRWLNQIRDFRNDSVHSGFRFQDIDIGRLRLFNRVADTACLNLHSAAMRAIHLGATTRRDLVDFIDVVFAEWDPSSFFESTIGRINDMSDI